MDVTAVAPPLTDPISLTAKGEGQFRATPRGAPSREGADRETAQKVARLKEIDQKVRAHEAAHMAAAAGLVVQGARFQTVRGPDGKSYAVGGDVRIDTSPGRTPEETLRKAEQIRAAALAPADPSPQDIKVAAQAAQMAMAARLELARQGERANSASQPGEESALPRSWRAKQALAAYQEAASSAAPRFFSILGSA
jgi:hypothetical protein